MTSRVEADGSPIRVAHVQPMSLDLFGHADIELGSKVRYSVSNLAVAQAARGDRPSLHLFASGRPSQTSFDGVQVVFHKSHALTTSHRTEKRFARQFGSSMLQAIRAEDYDIVHFHGTRQFHAMYAAVAWKAAREALPVVAQERGYRDVGRVESFVQSFALRKTDAFLAASTEGVTHLTQRGVEQERISNIANGYDPRAFFPDDARMPPGDPFRLLVVSRLSPEKHPLVMADAMSELVRRGCRVEVTIVSGGPLKHEVENRLRQAGVTATFLDHLEQGDLGAYYRSSDALVLTSPVMGVPQVVLEAMASGCPVVASDVAGVRETVQGAGTVVPPDDPGAVADAIQLLVGDHERWAGMRASALSRARDFTWAAIADRTREIYRRVLADRDRTARGYDRASRRRARKGSVS